MKRLRSLLRKLLLALAFGAAASSTLASDAGIVLNGYAAKDYCSCRFVVGQTKKHCKSRVGVGFPLPHGKIRVDEENGIVVVGRDKPENVRIAYWTRGRLGCVLLEPGARVERAE